MRNRKLDIEKYLRGELTPAEMHALEKEALSDPFLAEALEGIEQAGKDNFLFDLHDINRSLHSRTRGRARGAHRTLGMWGWTSAIAATLLLIAVSGFLVINILKKQSAERQATQELAMLTSDTAAKDTVVIPLPPEPRPLTQQPVPPSAQQREPGRQEQSRSAGVAQSTDGDPAHTAEDIPLQEESAIDDAGLKDSEELLALESAVEEEIGKKAAEAEVAMKAADQVTQVPADAIVQSPDQIAGARSDRDREESRKSRAAAPSREEPAGEIVAGETRAGSRLVRGRVLSASDGEALPGVNVVIKGTNNGTVTDPEGNFALVVPGENAALQFAFIGYEPQEVPVDGRAELSVQMAEDVTSLSEVVVTGYGTSGGAREMGTFTLASPQGGRTGYKDYLAGAVRYPQQALNSKVEGRVTVRFTVEPNGQLTDFEVVKGIGYGCDEELIRAIREGPAWTPSRRGSLPLRDQVKIRYRFQLLP